MQGRNNTRRALTRAREGRQAMSHAAVLVWMQLRRKQLGFSFTKEYPFGPYWLDFYCRELRLCIEIDGDQHADRIEHDRRRDAYLAENGIKTIRYGSMLPFKEMDGLVQSILAECEIRRQELENGA